MDDLLLRLFQLRLDRYAKAVLGQEGPTASTLHNVRMCCIIETIDCDNTLQVKSNLHMSTEYELFITTVLVQNWMY